MERPCWQPPLLMAASAVVVVAPFALMSAAWQSRRDDAAFLPEWSWVVDPRLIIEVVAVVVAAVVPSWLYIRAKRNADRRAEQANRRAEEAEQNADRHAEQASKERGEMNRLLGILAERERERKLKLEKDDTGRITDIVVQVGPVSASVGTVPPTVITGPPSKPPDDAQGDGDDADSETEDGEEPEGTE